MVVFALRQWSPGDQLKAGAHRRNRPPQGFNKLPLGAGRRPHTRPANATSEHPTAVAFAIR